MSPAPKFLVVDDNPDCRFLLVKSLQRKFPSAVLHECQSGEAALDLVKSEKLAAIVAHRSTEMAGIALIQKLRQQNGQVPIVMVSSIDRREAARAAGANLFLLYDEWPRLGTAVEELLGIGALA